MKEAAIQTKGLGKRYGSFWALENCSIDVPQGSVSALVGPNGAGKSTLMKLLVGLSLPSAGSSEVLGKPPVQTEEFLADIGYLAQEVPLYGQLDANDHIRMGKHLNPRWDEALIHERLNALNIPLDRAIGKLSGGQRAQVALALALAKKPKLLLLDEPVASLDPLARHDFLSSLAQAVAEGDLTVVMSSHLLADLERVCDHVIVLAAGRTQLCDNVEAILKNHRLLVGSKKEGQSDSETGYTVVQATHTPRQSTLLIRLEGNHKISKHWQQHDATIEEIVLAYMGQSKLQTEGATR